MMVEKYDLQKAVLLRFLRTVGPQMPALIAFLLPHVPDWVGAVLVFVGGGLTAIDKLAREKGWWY